MLEAPTFGAFSDQELALVHPFPKELILMAYDWSDHFGH
jgi:hypothetical protein